MARIDYDTQVTTLDGRETTLREFEGKTMLVVNTASKCGFTPQYEGLEKLWSEKGGDDFVILGFPCNQFGRQEPGSEGEIAEFCQLNYGVSFPMFSKVDVNGADAHPLFVQLKEAAPGLMGTKAIKWNFTKFLVGPDGEVVQRYGSATKPEDIGPDVDALKR